MTEAEAQACQSSYVEERLREIAESHASAEGQLAGAAIESRPKPIPEVPQGGVPQAAVVEKLARIDPIEYAWSARHKTPLPPKLRPDANGTTKRAPTAEHVERYKRFGYGMRVAGLEF